MSLLFLFAGINNTGAGRHRHRGKGSTQSSRMMLGISKLMEK